MPAQGVSPRQQPGTTSQRVRVTSTGGEGGRRALTLSHRPALRVTSGTMLSDRRLEGFVGVQQTSENISSLRFTPVHGFVDDNVGTKRLEIIGDVG